MKKKIIIIIAFLLFLVGCNKKEEIDYEKIESDTKIVLLEVTNVTEEKIKENYHNIIDNLNDKDKIESIMESAYYLKEVSAYTEDSKVYTLSIKTIEYFKDKISNYKEILSLGEETKEEEFYMIYLAYHKNVTFKNLFNNQNLQVTADLNDESRRKVSYIEEAVDYIDTHINNPLENNEVAEKIAYYSLFLSLKGKNIVNKLGLDTKEYLLSLDNDNKKKITKDLETIKKNKNKYLTEYLKEIK